MKAIALGLSLTLCLQWPLSAAGLAGPYAYAERGLYALAPNGSSLQLDEAVLDLTSARIALEVQDAKPFGFSRQAPSQKLYPSYGAAALGMGGEGMVTVNMADAAGKEIFDSCLAGIQLALEKDPALSKGKLLSDLLAALDRKKADLSPAAYRTVHELLTDAARASKGPQSADSPELRAFFSDPMRSNPIGFWSWSGALKGIFAQDRYLQSQFSLASDRAAFDALKALLAGSPEALNSYRRYASLEQILNNPFTEASLLSSGGEGGSWAFLPSTRSNETELQKELAAKGQILMDPMDEVIKRLKDGRLSFETKRDSGYYDYQQHALESILLADRNPEARKVKFGPKYLKRLEEAFKTGMAKARESHVKSLQSFGAISGAVNIPPPPIVYITPFVPLEPLPTAYERYAAGFDFLIRALTPLLGGRRVMTYDPYGSPAPVLAKLEEARRLFYGLELLSADELGMPRREFHAFTKVQAALAVQDAKNWVASAAQRPELSRDARFAVPVSVDPKETQPRMIHCWGTAGVSLVDVEAEFLDKPSYHLTGRRGGEVRFVSQSYQLPVDKFVSFTVPYEKGPLTREEFRKVLDSSKSIDEALARLTRGDR